MKKIVSLALAILMVACLASVFASADVDPEIGVNRAVSIYETETAPVVDGVVNEGEYGDPIAVWPTDSIMQYKGDYAKTPKIFTMQLSPNVTTPTLLTTKANTTSSTLITLCP